MIENDERLAALIDRIDNGELLTGKDAKYYNAKSARHEALMAQLGYEYEDDDEFDEAPDNRSLVEQWEDDEWDSNDNKES